MLKLVVAIIWLVLSLGGLIVLLIRRTYRTKALWIFLICGVSGMQTIGALNKYYWATDAYLVLVAFLVSVSLSRYINRNSRRGGR